MTGKYREMKGSGVKQQSLPEPQDGVNRIVADEGIPIFQMLLGENMASTRKKAVWVDSGNEASTYALSSAGTQEMLERVVIGRAFTAFQHYHIVNRIEEFLEPETEYLILPNIDQQYKNGNISEKEMHDLFSDLISKIESITEERSEIKVLYSFYDERPHEINSEMGEITDDVIEVEKSSQGLRTKSGSGDRLFYREKGAIQTTISFWRRERYENPENTVKVNYDGENKQYV